MGWLAASRVWLASTLPPKRDAATKSSADQVVLHGNISTESAETLRLLNDEATRRLDGQRSTATQVETKAAALMTASLTGLAFVLSHFHTAWTTLPTVAGFSISLLCGLGCLITRTWRDAPSLYALLSLIERDEIAMLDAVGRAKTQEFERNRDLINVKADWLKLLTWSFGASAVVLFATIVA